MVRVRAAAGPQHRPAAGWPGGRFPRRPRASGPGCARSRCSAGRCPRAAGRCPRAAGRCLTAARIPAGPVTGAPSRGPGAAGGQVPRVRCPPRAGWPQVRLAGQAGARGPRAHGRPPGLSSAALVAAYAHDHAAGGEVFAGPPKITVGNARDRLADHARDRALPPPACDIIACIWRELARQVFGPVAQVVPDAVTKPGRVWPVAACCHTATLTLLAGLGIRSRARDLAGPAAGPVRDRLGQLREPRPHHQLSRAAPRQPVRACHWPHGHPRTRRPTCHLPEPRLRSRCAGCYRLPTPGPSLVPGRALFP